MDASSEDIGPAGVKLIAEALRTSVTGALTSLNLGDNQLCGLDGYGRGTYTADGITAIADALRVNGSLTSLDLSINRLGAEGAAALAPALAANGLLTSLDLSNNYLTDEGVSAVCEAIKSNKETKLASLNFGNNGIGPVGANAVAAMVVVTGSLTKMRYVTPQTNLSEFGSDWIHIYIRGASDARDCLCTSLAFASLRRPHLRDAALCAPPLCVPARCMCCKGALLSRISCH